MCCCAGGRPRVASQSPNAGTSALRSSRRQASSARRHGPERRRRPASQAQDSTGGLHTARLRADAAARETEQLLEQARAAANWARSWDEPRTSSPPLPSRTVALPPCEGREDAGAAHAGAGAATSPSDALPPPPSFDDYLSSCRGDALRRAMPAAAPCAGAARAQSRSRAGRGAGFRVRIGRRVLQAAPPPAAAASAEQAPPALDARRAHFRDCACP